MLVVFTSALLAVLALSTHSVAAETSELSAQRDIGSLRRETDMLRQELRKLAQVIEELAKRGGPIDAPARRLREIEERLKALEVEIERLGSARPGTTPPSPVLQTETQPPALLSSRNGEGAGSTVPTMGVIEAGIRDGIIGGGGSDSIAAQHDPTLLKYSQLVSAEVTTPVQPIPLVHSGPVYVNISFDTLIDFGGSTTPDVSGILNLGDHDPVQSGFTLPNSEIVLEGAVDPYFKGLADVVFKLDKEGQTSTELEETYLSTSSLPWRLQVKAGQFFAEFGRQNPQHPHQWAFIDQPLVLNRMFGPDGLRNPGLQLSWLATTPFYLEFMLAVLNGNGETAWSFRNPVGSEFSGRQAVARDVRGIGDMLYVPRVTASVDVTSNQTVLMGASAAIGPNSSGLDTNTRISGLDVYWKWRKPNAMRGYPFVSFQAEALSRRYQAGADPVNALPAQTLDDWGYYAQVLWGFRTRWVAGLRGESADSHPRAFPDDDVWRAPRSRVSPNLTWYPTEFSKLRMQYNYDNGELFGHEHSVWFQMEFLLGSHGAHKF